MDNVCGPWGNAGPQHSSVDTACLFANIKENRSTRRTAKRKGIVFRAGFLRKGCFAVTYTSRLTIKRSGSSEVLQNKVSAMLHGNKGENDEAISEALVNRPQVIVKLAG